MKRIAAFSVALVVVGAVAFFAYQRSGPAPVAPLDIEGLDPLVRERIESEMANVDSHRRSREAWLRLGMAYEANGLYGEAAASYAARLQADSGDAKARHRLACVQERTGDLALAAQTMQRAAEDDPGYVGSWTRLSWWLVDLGELDAASEALARARALAPDAMEVAFADVRLRLAQRDAEGALRVVEEGGWTEGQYAPHAFYLASLARRQLGDLNGAARAHEQSDGSRPSFTDPWTLEVSGLKTGYAAMRIQASRDVGKGRYERAEGQLRRIVEHDPNDASSLNLLGVCRMELGDLDEAIELFERALDAEPDYDPACVNHARVLLRRKPRDLAAMEATRGRLRDAVERRPRDEKGWRVLADVDDVLGRLDDVAVALGRAIELNPEDVALAVMAGYVDVRRERFDDALVRFREVQQADPEHTEAWFGEVTALLYAGRASEARTALRALGDRPDADPTRLGRLRTAVASME